jgi:hypothetical protein
MQDSRPRRSLFVLLILRSRRRGTDQADLAKQQAQYYVESAFWRARDGLHLRD